MKKLALVLLLVPAFSTAAVKLEVQARCGEDFIEKTFELTEANSVEIANDCGTTTRITLSKEMGDSAEFAIDVTKTKTDTKGSVDESSVVTVNYGEPTSFKCQTCEIDAEIAMIVSHVADQEAS